MNSHTTRSFFVSPIEPCDCLILFSQARINDCTTQQATISQAAARRSISTRPEGPDTADFAVALRPSTAHRWRVARAEFKRAGWLFAKTTINPEGDIRSDQPSAPVARPETRPAENQQ